MLADVRTHCGPAAFGQLVEVAPRVWHEALDDLWLWLKVIGGVDLCRWRVGFVRGISVKFRNGVPRVGFGLKPVPTAWRDEADFWPILGSQGNCSTSVGNLFGNCRTTFGDLSKCVASNFSEMCSVCLDLQINHCRISSRCKPRECQCPRKCSIYICALFAREYNLSRPCAHRPYGRADERSHGTWTLRAFDLGEAGVPRDGGEARRSVAVAAAAAAATCEEVHALAVLLGVALLDVRVPEEVEDLGAPPPGICPPSFFCRGRGGKGSLPTGEARCGGARRSRPSVRDNGGMPPSPTEGGSKQRRKPRGQRFEQRRVETLHSRRPTRDRAQASGCRGQGSSRNPKLAERCAVNMANPASSGIVQKLPEYGCKTCPEAGRRPTFGQKCPKLQNKQHLAGVGQMWRMLAGCCNNVVTKLEFGFDQGV